MVTTPHISAIRDAGYCIHLLDTYQFTDIDLIVNAYDEKMVKKHQIKVTRIATGVPLGGELGSVDGNTLALSLNYRRDM